MESVRGLGVGPQVTFAHFFEGYIQGLCRLGLEFFSNGPENIFTYTKPNNVCFANNKEFWKKGCRNTADKTQFTLQTNQNFRMLETLTGRK